MKKETKNKEKYSIKNFNRDIRIQIDKLQDERDSAMRIGDLRSYQNKCNQLRGISFVIGRFAKLIKRR